MSGRQRFIMDKAWQALLALNEDYGRMVSAGEFARALLISRNTAHNWLIQMAAEEAIEYDSRFRGSVPHYRFGIAGFTFNGTEAE